MMIAVVFVVACFRLYKEEMRYRSILCRLPLCDKFLITGEMELWSFVSNATATRVSRGTLLYTEKIIQS